MKKLNMSLSTKSINETIREIDKYQKMLPIKLKQVEERLMLMGILVARESMTDIDGNDTRSLIDFKQNFKTTNYGCVGILIEYDIQPIISRWFRGGEIVSAEVSPSLMLEFGSGSHAEAGHRGTFPNQTHANDPQGWFWKDENGNYHHSYGLYPTHPLYNAFIEMYQNVDSVVKEVFGDV